MKSKSIAFVSSSLARVVGKLGQDSNGPNGPKQNAENTAPDHDIRTDLPGYLFAVSALDKPMWAFLRVEDVIR